MARNKLKTLNGSKQQSKSEIAIDEILEREDTSYSNAADVAHLAMKAGFKVSIGCLSAKDRTGFVAALIALRIMREDGFSESHLSKIIRNQLKKNSPAVKVIVDNTKATVMKIAPFFIEGITLGKFNAKSFVVRCLTYAEQGQLIIKEKLNERRPESQKTFTSTTNTASAAA